MIIKTHAKNATVDIDSKVLYQTDFLAQTIEKEVTMQLNKRNWLLQEKSPVSISLLKQLYKETQKTIDYFKSILALIIKSPQVTQMRTRMMGVSFLPFMNSDILPPEVVTMGYKLILGMLALYLLGSIIAYIASAFYSLINQPEEAKKWQKNIRSGLRQALTAIPIVLLIAYSIEFILTGTIGHVSVFGGR